MSNEDKQDALNYAIALCINQLMMSEQYIEDGCIGYCNDLIDKKASLYVCDKEKVVVIAREHYNALIEGSKELIRQMKPTEYQH